METQHDFLRHLRYLRQSLSQDNESIGFFLSAGCPLSVTMPEDKWPLIPDVLNLTKHINQQLSGNTQYQLLLSELHKAEKNTQNIEDILSFLRSLLLVSRGGHVRGLSESDLSDLEVLICKEIVQKLDVELPTEDTPYHKLCNWIRSIDRKVAIEIFTTNYDLLAEQALEDSEVPYFDGFVGSKRSFFDLRALEDNLIPVHWTRLWKIHGSINWYQKSDGKQRKVYRSSSATELISKDVASNGGASHLIYPSHLKYEESRKMPYLALIDQLNRFIRKKSSFLILSGYSFNDGHLNDAIVNSLKANPTAMVLGLMFGKYEKKTEAGEVVEAYPEAYRLAKNQHNLNIWTFDKAIIGTNLGNWTRNFKREDDDSDLMRFVTFETVTEDPQTSELLIKLGDFALFTDFLKKIIGTTKDSSHG